MSLFAEPEPWKNYYHLHIHKDSLLGRVIAELQAREPGDANEIVARALFVRLNSYYGLASRMVRVNNACKTKLKILLFRLQLHFKVEIYHIEDASEAEPRIEAQ